MESLPRLLLLLFSFSFLFLEVHCERTVGSFFIQDKLTPIAEYGFVENGTLDISMNTMPEINNNIKVVVCSEREHAKLMALEPSKFSGCQVHKSVNCSVNEIGRGGHVQVVVGTFGRYTLSVLLCEKPVTVNFSCLSTNPSPFHFFPSSSSSSSSSSDPRSHLDSQLLPVVATEQVAGLMWAGVALAYLFTLRQYWRRARLLQKIIAAYPIAKVAFAYYSGTFFSHYSEFGYFTASQWAGYWTFSILLKTSLALLLMAITVCATTLGSKLKLNDVAIVIGLLVGIVIVSALECSIKLSQVSTLILWMVELVLYVLMMSFLLIGVTSGLSKTGSILKSVIRRNTSETRRRVISNRNLRESQSRVSPPSGDDNNNNNESAENSSPSASQEHTSSDQRLNEPSITTEQNNDVELRPQESEFHPVDLQERAHASSMDADNTSINVATGEVDPSLDGRGLLDSLTPSQLTNLNNSIAYLLPYIWFTRFNLFASFKFVLLFWVFLQIVAFFINLVPGTGIDSLNWLGLMTTEILDFIVFAGVTYTFLMSSRYPFSDSMTQRNSRRSHRGRHDPEDHPLLPDDQDQDQDQDQANQAGDLDLDPDLDHDLDSDPEADDLELELEEQNNNNEATALSRSQQISGLPSRGPGLEIQEEEEEEEEEDDEEKLLARSASTSLAKK